MPILLFDLDDTLVDRHQAFEVWASGFSSLHRMNPDESAWLRALDDEGRTPREVFWGSMRDRLDLPDAVEVLVARWGVEFPALYECTPETLDAVGVARAAGWATGIVTNGDAQVQARKIASAHLDRLVDTVCISGAEGVEKPDPNLFRLAAQRLGQSCADGWMIGDNAELDVLGGTAAGLQTVWLRRGRAGPPTEVAPTMTADTVQEAITRIMARNPRS